MVILGKCKCMRKAPKQAIEWALDYHLITIARELRGKEDLLKEAKAEFKEITGKEPGIYSAEAKLQRLKDEIDFYLGVRKEIIELPRCDEPAFEVQSGNPHTIIRDPQELWNAMPIRERIKVSKRAGLEDKPGHWLLLTKGEQSAIHAEMQASYGAEAQIQRLKKEAKE